MTTQHTDPATLEAGREADAIIAGVMGWADVHFTRSFIPNGDWYGIMPGDNDMRRLWDFTTTGDGMLEMVDWLSAQIGISDVWVCLMPDHSWKALAGKGKNIISAEAPTAPLAVARAIHAWSQREGVNDGKSKSAT